ncbi:hypothetical protein BYT27DRAFT_7186774 [Phlegmacium glaucopus]|nr:hypothetical protein BYT27DRAFT_7186774 [Phlegmacium glaucopus]
MLNNIIRDYRLLSEYRIRFPIVIYFISNGAKFSQYVTNALILLQQHPLSTCDALQNVLDAFSFSLSHPPLNPWIVTLFSGLWLAVVAASQVGRESCVVIGDVTGYSAAASIVPLINDTLGFPHFRDYLPVFYKAFLQDGQAYYMVIVTVNVLTVIMFFDRSISDSLRTVPNVVLTNIMACRVFRNTIFGSVRESQISTSFVAREPNVDSVIPLAVREETSGDSSTKQAGDGSFKIDGIAVTQTVERKHDYGTQ